MDLMTLNDKELKVFIEYGIPLERHRKIYIDNPKLAQKLKGFRLNTVPLSFLVKTSITLIRKEKNNALVKLFTNYYKETLKNNVDKLISDGYPKEIARSLAIVNEYNDKFLPIFFKLEGIQEDEQKKIFDETKMIELIENVCCKKMEKLLKENFDSLKKNTIESIDSMKQEMKNIRDAFNLVKSDVALLKTTILENNQKIGDIEKNYVLKTLLDANLASIAKKSDEDHIVLMTKVANSDSIMELQNEVVELKKLIKGMSTNIDSDDLLVSNNLNEDYEQMDDYLIENIGDVIENIASGDHFDVLREYLMEVIYSNKPIVCSTKNATLLANILSSIVTGGNYYTISVNSATNDERLIQRIDSIPTVSNNKVIVIKNKIGVSDYGNLLEYIKSRPFNEKFIFEVALDKELFFMPSESLDNFHFFIGQLNVGKINYKYSYDFSNDRRKPLTNTEFKNALEAIGAHLSIAEIMNVKFYGLLAFSIIPFVAINSDTEPTELVNKLLSHSLRQKCEAIIHD